MKACIGVRTIAALLVAAAIPLGASLSPALAQAGCSDYARLALQQARESQQRKCGFAGPEWSTDLRAHAAWCATVGPEQWKASLQKRAQMLASQCRR